MNIGVWERETSILEVNRDAANDQMLDASRESTLHLVSVRHSTVLLEQSVRSIHITDCQHLTMRLRINVQQVRIHESSDVRIILETECTGCSQDVAPTGIQGGVILEGSTKIQFLVPPPTSCRLADGSMPDRNQHSDPRKSMTHLDIRDFDWLRTDVCSPNFTVHVRQYNQSDDANTDEVGEKVASQSIVAPLVASEGQKDSSRSTQTHLIEATSLVGDPTCDMPGASRSEKHDEDDEI
jgi:hypothetical protein